MTRKDYQVIAQVLANLYSDFNNGGSDEVSLSLVVDEMSKALEQDNPRFNADNFRKACGL